METDCLLLVSTLKGSSTYLNIVGVIIQDCKALLVELSLSSFEFVRRLANIAAHVLAKAAGFESGLGN